MLYIIVTNKNYTTRVLHVYMPYINDNNLFCNSTTDCLLFYANKCTKIDK